MTDSDKKGGKPTLSLRRTTREMGRVRQNIAHGRSKTVVVETKRKRVIARPGTAKQPAQPAPEQPAPAAPEPRPEPAPAPKKAPPRAEAERKAAEQAALEGLTPEERAARERAMEMARQRAEEEARRKEEAERRRAEEEARRKKEAEARRREEEERARREEEERQRKLAEEAAARQAQETARKKAGEKAAKPKAEAAAPKKAEDPRRKREREVKPARPAKGGGERRRGKLTIAKVLSGDTEEERARSLAAFRRRMERQKKQQQGGGAQQREKISREVVIPEAITIQELAHRMAERAVDVIKFLMKQGEMHKITDVIDADTAELIVEEFGHRPKRVTEADVEEGLIDGEDAPETLKPRPPVITVMGHVDHGKTSLLDAIRKTRVTEGEAGGITQHIGAYQVKTEGGHITFLDTPGHEAFTSMRARGAKATDIVVLVVAADDGVKPQTVEAISHARAAQVPIIVAINKMDKPDADPTRVRTELMQHEVFVESMGGEVLDVEVSALTGQGLAELLEAIQLQAELMELKANPDRSAQGLVIEARLDKGRGPVATIIVQRGTLKVGDIVVAGSAWGRVRALIDDAGRKVERAGPSMPVEVLGFHSVPDAGDVLVVVESEARARQVAEYRERKKREARGAALRKASLEQLMNQMKEGELKEFPVLVKADVQGSAEAIVQALEKLGNEEVRARIVHFGVGGISESDVQLASATGAVILGFNVRADRNARELAEREGIEVRYYNIIYDLVEDMKQAMSGLLEPEIRETHLGNAEVLEVFKVSGVGRVAGCRVAEGVVRRGAGVRLIRDNVVIYEGRLTSLKRFKDEVEEVPAGQECGMAFENFQDIRKGDVVECYQVEKIERNL